MNSMDDHPAINKNALMDKRELERWENEGGKILADSTKLISCTYSELNNDPAPSSRGIIKMHLQKLKQLFDSWIIRHFAKKISIEMGTNTLLTAPRNFLSKHSADLPG